MIFHITTTHENTTIEKMEKIWNIASIIKTFTFKERNKKLKHPQNVLLPLNTDNLVIY